MSPDEERFWTRVNKTETCWLWTGGRVPDGYGMFRANKTQMNTHRWAWLFTHGTLPPKGTHLDHLCRVRACVNPDHLEVVTPRTNALRGIGITAVNAKKTHCEYGHEYTPENTYARPGSPSHRSCRICDRIYNKHARRKRKYLNGGTFWSREHMMAELEAARKPINQ